MMRPLRSEVTKLSSLRSNWILSLSVVVVTSVIGLLGINGLLPSWHAHLPERWDPTAVSLKGLLVGQLLAAMAGSAAIAGEYTSGMLVTSVLLTPARSRLLLAKGVVTAAAGLLTAIPAVGVSFGVGQFALGTAGLPTADLTDSRVWGALAGAVAYLVCLGLLGLACAVITRSSTGALGVIVTIALVLPALLPSLPDGIGRFWPTTAGQAGYAVFPAVNLPPSTGVLILIAFTLYSTVASHLVMRARSV